MLSRTLFLSKLLTFTMSSTNVMSYTGGTMIHLHQMTKEEYEEFNKHNILHDMAELVLQYGYDEVMSDLANILNNKLDKLEPC